MLSDPCPLTCVGEYMLRDVSDTDDDSFSGEEEDTTASARTPTIEPSDQSRSLIAPPATGTISTETKEAVKVESEESEVTEEDKGDPEMAPLYLKRLLPVFAELFHSSLAPPLRSV